MSYHDVSQASVKVATIMPFVVIDIIVLQEPWYTSFLSLNRYIVLLCGFLLSIVIYIQKVIICKEYWVPRWEGVYMISMQIKTMFILRVRLGYAKGVL